MNIILLPRIISESLLRSFTLAPLFAAIFCAVKSSLSNAIAAVYMGEDYRGRLQEASAEIKLGN